MLIIHQVTYWREAPKSQLQQSHFAADDGFLQNHGLSTKIVAHHSALAESNHNNCRATPNFFKAHDINSYNFAMFTIMQDDLYTTWSLTDWAWAACVHSYLLCKRFDMVVEVVSEW